MRLLLLFAVIMAGTSGWTSDLVSSATTSVIQKTCATLLQGASRDSSLRRAEQEIADLILEKAQVAKAGDSALLSLLEKNIKSKIAEYEGRTGQHLDENEVRQLILRKEATLHKQADENEKREEVARNREQKVHLEWNFAPVVIKENILREGHSIVPSEVHGFVDKNGKMKLSYRLRSDNSMIRGYFVVDLDTGTEFDLTQEMMNDLQTLWTEDGGTLVAVPFSLSSQAEISVLDTKVGKWQKCPLGKGWGPLKGLGFNRLRGIVTGFPYKTGDGRTAVIIKQYKDGVDVVYRLDLEKNSLKPLGDLDEFSSLYRSRDNQHVYAVGLKRYMDKDAADWQLELIVKDLVENRVMHEEMLNLNLSGYVHGYASAKVSYVETAAGHIKVAINVLNSNKILIRDLTTGQCQSFDRQEHEPDGGLFVEGSDGTTYYLPHTTFDSPEQKVINVDTGAVEKFPVGRFDGVRLIAAKNSHIGPIAFYTASTKGTHQTRKKVLIMRPLSSDHEPLVVKMSDLHAIDLADVAAMPDGRVVGIFNSDDTGAGGTTTEKHNLHLIQLLGPTGESK